MNVTDLRHDADSKRVRVVMDTTAHLWVVEYRLSPTLGTWVQSSATMAHSEADARSRFEKACSNVEHRLH